VAPAASDAELSASSPRSIVARPAGFQNAASPRPSSVAPVCPMATACAPTGKSRNSAPELLASSWADRSKTERWNEGTLERQTTARNVARHHVPPFPRSLVLSEVLRLIDQHDGDVVFHGVDQTAGLAHELFLRRGAVLQRPLAFGADEDCQQIGRETHPAYPRRLRDGAWRRHRGSTFTCSSRYTLP